MAADLKDLKRMEKEMGILQDARKEVRATGLPTMFLRVLSVVLGGRGPTQIGFSSEN